jgi:hypothetical protein
MQLRLVEGLATFLCGFALYAQTSAPDTQKPSEATKTVHQLWVEDQDDLSGGANGGPRFAEEEYKKGVAGRQAIVRAMLAAGEVKTGDDFRDAASLFQHGDSPDDFLFAHILAMEALYRGTTSARFIAAATLDRYLQFVKQPQVFGTQYVLDKSVPLAPNNSGLPLPFGRTLAPYNEGFLSDSVRTDFCVPTLPQQKENVALFNAGKWPRETMHPACH